MSFSQPVAMMVTKEQYDSLCPKMNNLGYKLCTQTGQNWSKSYLLATNINATNFNYNAVDKCRKDFYRRYFIEEYNEELFLAIAAMTKGDVPVVNEYCIVIKSWGVPDWSPDTQVGYIFPCTKVSSGHNVYIYTGVASNNGELGLHIRKATLSELVNHFSFILPERWCIKITKENLKTVGSYYNREGAECYTNSMHIGKYYQSHNMQSDVSVMRERFGANFYRDSKPDNYTEITTEQFKKYILKETNMIEVEKTYIVTRSQLSELHRIACTSWRETIEEYANKIIFPSEMIMVERSVLERAFNAAGGEQVALLNKIFPDFDKNDNPFKRLIGSDLLNKFSREAFGDGSLEIASSAAENIGRDDLKNRALFVSSRHEIILHDSSTGTVIEFKKRKK